MKVLIFDSGPLINFSMNGLLHLVEKLKQDFNGKFIITKYVKEEVYDRPVNIKKFELGALRIFHLIELSVIEYPEAVGVSEAELEKETSHLLEELNHAIKSNTKWINLVSKAETSCLALSLILSKKGIDNLAVIDERTARLLCEKPEALAKIMSKKLSRRLNLDIGKIANLKNIKVIRSPELAFVALKKGLISGENKRTLEAMLYATKYKGASISFDEIEELEKL